MGITTELGIYDYCIEPKLSSNRKLKMFGKDDTSDCGMYRPYLIGGVILAENDGSKDSYFHYDCTVSMRTVPGMNINLRFETFKVISDDPESCGNHRLEIYDGFNSTERPLTSKRGLCSNYTPSDEGTSYGYIPDEINSSQGGVTVRLRRAIAPLAEFKIIFTSFYNYSDGDCFSCVNTSGLCISRSLTCDGIYNCINGADEDVIDGPCRGDLHTLLDLSKVGLMLIVGVSVVLSVALILVSIIVLFYLVRYIRRRREYVVEVASMASMCSTDAESQTYSRLNSISSRTRHHPGDDSTPVMSRDNGNHSAANGSALNRESEDTIEMTEKT
ncbi:neuropilin and tolloid-like protein 1 [Saccoglossus kowalevskii]